MPYAQLSKLTLKDMGEPQIIKTLPETTREMLLGTLYGKASDFVKRTLPDGSNEMEGLRGNFRVIPIDVHGEVQDSKGRESAILFIPEAFHNAIADQLRSAKGLDSAGVQIPGRPLDPGAEIMFIYDVTVIRAKNPQGYSWMFKPAKEYTKSPLDDLVIEHKAIKAALPKPTAAKQIAAGNK